MEWPVYSVLIMLLVGLFVCVVMQWLHGQRQIRLGQSQALELNRLTSEIGFTKQLQVHAEQERAQAQSQFQQQQAEVQQLREQNQVLITRQAEREERHEHQLQELQVQKEILLKEFKAVAQEVLSAQTIGLQTQSQAGLQAVLNPFGQAMQDFKAEVQAIHHREATAQGQLHQELAQLKDLNLRMTNEAQQLANALKGQKKLQGAWGELILENVLERCGLQLGQDYRKEVSRRQSEQMLRPDVVVYLPQNKHLIIDEKVSLNAYTRFINAETEAEGQQALREHVKAMNDRVTELADRDYAKLDGLNSPEVVFLFVPIESAFVEALKADELLCQRALDRNILLTTPTTLLTSLNIVRQLWRFEDQNKNMLALARKAEAVHKKLKGFLTSFYQVKTQLDRAHEAYSKAEGQLLDGKGNLVKQVDDFKQLAPGIHSDLPEYFLQKAELGLKSPP